MADLHDLLNELRVQATSSAGGFASVFKGKALPALLAAVDTLNAQGWVTYVHGAEESDGITFVTLGESWAPAVPCARHARANRTSCC